MGIQSVGIIGAGTMGNGIAQACAVSGLNVIMVDILDLFDQVLLVIFADLSKLHCSYD